MKVLIVLAVSLALSCCAPNQFVAVTEDTLGNYKLRFDAGDLSRSEVRKEDGDISGYYEYVSPDGAHHRVDYTAGAEKGFIVKSDDLPVAPVHVTELPVAPVHVTESSIAQEDIFNGQIARNIPVKHPVEISTFGKKVRVLVPVITYVQA